MMNTGSLDFRLNKFPGSPNYLNFYSPPTDTKLPDPPKDEKENNQVLNNLITKTQKTLLEVKSIFIFDLFPDKLIIDQNKVNFIFKDAFGVSSIHSILIEFIAFVEVHLSFLTGTLLVVDMSNFRIPMSLIIKNLKRRDALRARKLIQGLIHAKKVGIDFNQFESTELENRLENLGNVLGED